MQCQQANRANDVWRGIVSSALHNSAPTIWSLLCTSKKSTLQLQTQSMLKVRGWAIFAPNFQLWWAQFVSTGCCWSHCCYSGSAAASPGVEFGRVGSEIIQAISQATTEYGSTAVSQKEQLQSAKAEAGEDPSAGTGGRSQGQPTALPAEIIVFSHSQGN